MRDTLIGATNSHKWWSTLKTALFGVDVTVPLLLRHDGSRIYCLKEKAALFDDVFESHHSNDSLTLPQMFTYFSGEIKNLLLELDLCGAGPNGIFSLS